jgi:L-cysteine/cystine lyase
MPLDITSLRAAFPALRHTAYLNAGTAGPVPLSAFEAAKLELEAELRDGRSETHFLRRAELRERLRAGWAHIVGCDPSHLALVSSTREALARVLDGMQLGRGAEIVTSRHEHPALDLPLRRTAARGARVRAVPLGEVADAVRPSTTLVACSHVAWDSGDRAPAALAELDVPVILDGAQAAGAIPVDVEALGCSAYAAPGQKWLCGAEGTAMLFIHPELLERLPATSLPPMGIPAPGETAVTARVHDAGAPGRAALAASLAALEILETAGFERLQQRAMRGAAVLAASLRDSGMHVAERDETTLVAWSDDDAELTHRRLEARAILVRLIDDRSLVRASVGGWTTDDDLDRLLSNVTS